MKKNIKYAILFFVVGSFLTVMMLSTGLLLQVELVKGVIMTSIFVGFGLSYLLIDGIFVKE